MKKNVCLLPRIAIWLVPGQPERAILQTLITELSDRFSAPSFIPHVTIYSCRRTSMQNELAITASLGRDCPPIILHTDGLASRDRLTRALFVRLRSDKKLQWLRESLQNELPQSQGDDFDPHVSLLYQLLPVAERASLAGEILCPLKEIRFDQIWAVAIPETINAVENLSGWQTLLSCRLASGRITDKIQVRKFAQ